MSAVQKIEVSRRTVIFTALFLIGIWVLYYIRDIILLFFVSLLIMTILNPLINRLARYKVPRSLAIAGVYVLLLAVISFSLAAIFPPLIDQTTSFINNLPDFLDGVGFLKTLSDEFTQQLAGQFGDLPREIAKLAISTVSNIFTLITILILSFYLLVARHKLDEQLGFFFGDRKQKEIGQMIDILEVKLGGWARGQLALMVIVGVANYVGLVLLGIPYALPLAILAGLLEIVPFIGPIIAAIPAVIIGFGISPLLGFATIALAFLIQQLENYVLVPNIMQRTAGINPVVTLLALLIGFEFAGVTGMILSVPIVITLQVVSREYFLKSSN